MGADRKKAMPTHFIQESSSGKKDKVSECLPLVWGQWLLFPSML